MNQIVELLKTIGESKDSDLFVVAGKPPFRREFGEVVPLGEGIVSDEAIDAFRESVLLDEAERTFQKTGGYDAGHTMSDGQRFRLNFLLQQGRPAFVARSVPSGDVDFDELNLPPVLRELAESPRGLILIVGTAGSGKSTTMAALVNHINESFNKHVVTIEDPIEYLHQDKNSLITQREVGADVSSFGEAMRHVVRESPDVILIGEMRDHETMRTAIQASLTGHLVISTMHTADTLQCLERVINHFPEHQREQIADDLAIALSGVVGQRLLRRKDRSGMVPAVEILKATPLVRSLIAARNFDELEDAMKRGQEDGMVTFTRSLSELHKQGVVSLEEGAAAATNREEFLLYAQGMESGVDTFRDSFRGGRDGDEGLNMKRLLHSAVANNASDLLITAGARPCLRLDGEITPLATEPLTATDTKRLLFSVLNAHQRARFEEEREIDFALTSNIRRSKDKGGTGMPYRFRVNGFYQRGNIAVAIRVIAQTIFSPEDLGIPKSVVKMVKRRNGLLLVTGPTGHGKSTTLSSLIDVVNSERACHIITIEDPIEYVHENKKAVVEQREVHADTRSFSNALKYVLRQDPDVILVGEMRDNETMGAALTAAETGHLVMATLHTNNAAQSVDRIIDSFPAHQQNQIRLQLSGCLLGIVSQRLISKIDGNGRVAAFETLIGTTAVRALIREGKTHMIPSVMETGHKDGMVTMDKSLDDLLGRGVISQQDHESLRTLFSGGDSD